MTSSARSVVARWRGRYGLVLPLIVAAAVAFATAITVWVSSGERVAQLWISATVAEDGSAEVVEVIDYDFGANSRHGIFRDVPDLRTTPPVRVTSPDAPDDVFVTPLTQNEERIRIGDPNETVSGLHRYVLRYTLDDVVPETRIAWDAVGTGWEVPIRDVEVHVTAAAALDAEQCVTGSRGSTQPCAVSESEPGHLVATVEELDPGEGITLSATPGATLDGAPSPPSPPADQPSTGPGPLTLAGLAAVLVVLASLATQWLLRRDRRDHAPAAIGRPTRIDREELARHAAPSSAIPGSLTAAQGGVLHDASISGTHKAAWLVGEAVAGTIDLEVVELRLDTEIVLVRLLPGEGFTRTFLDRAFGRRQRLPLGVYDTTFAAAWKQLDEHLSTWRQTSGLWDAAADRRAALARRAGLVTGPLGLVLAPVGGVLAANWNGLGLPLVAVAAVLAGAGFSAVFYGQSSRALTAEGSALWLQVESLRQFLADSPARVIDREVQPDRLGEYTAWAVSLGASREWSRLAPRVSATTRTPIAATTFDGATFDAGHLRYATVAPVLMTSCATTVVAPSTSSSSGGGDSGGGYSGGDSGGSVGGGDGGGGGGSW